MIFELKRIDIWSVVKITFVIFLILGFLFSLLLFALMNMFSGFVDQFGGSDMYMPESGGAMGIVGLFGSVFSAVFYAVIGSVFVAIGVAVYNLFASALGGFKFYFVEHEITTTEQPVQTVRTIIEKRENSEKENQEQ